MNHHAGFKTARNRVIEYLLGPGRDRGRPRPPQATLVAAESAAANDTAPARAAVTA